MKVRNIVLVLLLCLMQMLLPAGAWGEEARLIEQGNACYEAKDYEKAMEFYLRSVEEEDDPGALFNIGVLYAQRGGKGSRGRSGVVPEGSRPGHF